MYTVSTCSHDTGYIYLYPTPVHTLLESGVSGITSISSLDWTLAANLLARLGLPATERWQIQFEFHLSICKLSECPETEKFFLIHILVQAIMTPAKKVYICIGINFLQYFQWNRTLQTYSELNQFTRIWIWIIKLTVWWTRRCLLDITFDITFHLKNFV